MAFQRTTEVYYSPAQVTTYLNGLFVEDAVFVRYDVADRWTPLYGHNDRVYRDVALGQTAVQGELGVLFRYHGYLRRVIMQAWERKNKMAPKPREVASMRKGTARGIRNEDLDNIDDVLNFIDESVHVGSHKVAFDFLKKRFWSESGTSKELSLPDILGANQSDSFEDTVKKSERRGYYRPSTLKSPSGLNLWIVHGPDHNVGDRAYTEVVERIQFIGKSYRANIEVPEGERVITDVYPFIARDILPIGG